MANFPLYIVKFSGFFLIYMIILKHKMFFDKVEILSLPTLSEGLVLYI